MKECLKEHIEKFWTWFKTQPQFLFDKELSIRAAALSYYSLMGIIPLLAGIMLFGDFTQTSVSLSPIVRFILPSLDSTINSFDDFSIYRLSDLFSRYKGLGIIATIIIVLSVRSFLINIQQSFNCIWKSEDRDCKRREEFNFLLFIVGVIVILITTFIFNILPSDFWKSWFVLITVFLVVAVGFWQIPYDKHPKLLSAVLSSVIVVLLLWFWIKLLPWLSSSLSHFEFEGIQFLLLVFFMYWAWYICILGAKICRTIDKSDYLNMRVKIEELAPIYELFLSIFTMANIVRKFGSQDNKEKGLTFEEIRKDMFEFEGEEGKQNKDVKLPMPLLDRIIDKLRHQGFLDISKGDRGVKYVIACKRKDSFDMSVSDFLFQYFFYINFDLEKPYQKLQAELYDKLSTSFVQMACEFKDLKLKDLIADTSIVPVNDTPRRKLSSKLFKPLGQLFKLLARLFRTPKVLPDSICFKDHKKLYENFKTGHWEEELRQRYSTACKIMGYESLYKSINDMEYYPGKQFALQLIDQIDEEHKRDTKQ